MPRSAVQRGFWTMFKLSVFRYKNRFLFAVPARTGTVKLETGGNIRRLLYVVMQASVWMLRAS